MAICGWCKQEMVDGTDDCYSNRIKFPDGELMEAIRHSGDSPCQDCRVYPGGRHHPGCNKEQCPRCNGQLIGCGCLNDKDDLNETYNLYGQWFDS